MDLWKQIIGNETLLSTLINRSLVNSVQRTAAKCLNLKNNPQEPDFIADLTINWTPELYDILNVFFNRKINFGITSIYCHQKPLVDFGRKKKPEIGDILFVLSHTDKFKNKYFNSLLFQAKVTNNQISRVATADLEQLELYQKWPKFTYCRAGKLNGISRDIHPKSISTGAQYLLIDNDPVNSLMGLSGTFPFGCALPNKQLVLCNDFSNELVQFLKFKTGRTIDDKATAKDDWSKTIWDLIEISKNKASKRKNFGLKNFPRQITKSFDGCCFLQNISDQSFFNDLASDINGDGGEAWYHNDNYEDEEPSASIVFIESSENNIE